MTGNSGTLALQGFMSIDQQGAGGSATAMTLDDYLKSVERRALRMAQLATGDLEEALDIVQDSMLSFVRRYRNKPASEWPPLFYRTVDNRIKDFYRRNGVRRRWRVWLGGTEQDGPDPIQSAPDPANSTPDRQAADGEFAAALELALRRLPDRQRQAFLLRTLEGLSVAETASAMGCGQGSVKTHLSRANSALRNQLGAFR
jgi:RNA polymerase sigma-70 factor (ECF subfamily)